MKQNNKRQVIPKFKNEDKDVLYQSLMKVYLAEKVKEEFKMTSKQCWMRRCF